MPKKFTTINVAFQCENCHFKVPKASSTCRNHCPKCLFSKHVDILPGDRAETCHGLLEPIGYEQSKRDRYNIVFKCKKCRKVSRNKSVLDDLIEADLLDVLISLGPA